MSFNGTDWLVLLTVVLVIVAILTFLATILPKWQRKRFQAEATLVYPMPVTSGRHLDTIPDSRDYPPDKADRLGARGPTNFGSPVRLTQEGETVVPKPSASPVTVSPKVEASTTSADRQTSESPKPKRRKAKPPRPAVASAEWEDLIDETVTVPAGYGQHWVTRLDLDEGDEIRGTITEVDDDDFSYMVLDESNYAAFRGGDDYEVVDEAEESSSVRVDFSVDEADRYYLVLYAYGKQNDREAEVSLRVRTRH